MTQEQKLKLLGKLMNQKEPILEGLKGDNIEEVSSPTSVVESSSNPTEKVPRDEFTLTYDELIEEFNLFGKSAIMKPSTFDRLWQS